MTDFTFSEKNQSLVLDIFMATMTGFEFEKRFLALNGVVWQMYLPCIVNGTCG